MLFMPPARSSILILCAVFTLAFILVFALMLFPSIVIFISSFALVLIFAFESELELEFIHVFEFEFEFLFEFGFEFELIFEFILVFEFEFEFIDSFSFSLFNEGLHRRRKRGKSPRAANAEMQTAMFLANGKITKNKQKLFMGRTATKITTLGG